MHPIRKLAWAYAALFFFVVSLGYIPGLTDEAGYLFGLFTIDPIDDALHIGSALWAAGAAWHSARASRLYFQLFGALYMLDGILGLIWGHGYLDGGLLLHGPETLDFGTRFAANLPHLLIGGIALLIGFVLSRRWDFSPTSLQTE